MMQENLFRKKYLGEVTLKNGEHVKFLFPITESDLDKYQSEYETLYRRIQKNKKHVLHFKWVLADDLSPEQFAIAYTATKKYGEHYWKLVWQLFLENNKKKC